MHGILRFGVVSTPEIAQFQLGDLTLSSPSNNSGMEAGAVLIRLPYQREKEPPEGVDLSQTQNSEPEQQALAVDKGLRSADRTIALRAPISLDYGNDPSVTPAIVTSLPSPISALADAIQEVFHLTERRDVSAEP